MLNERPDGFVDRICFVDDSLCEGQGTIVDCDICEHVHNSLGVINGGYQTKYSCTEKQFDQAMNREAALLDFIALPEEIEIAHTDKTGEISWLKAQRGHELEEDFLISGYRFSYSILLVPPGWRGVPFGTVSLRDRGRTWRLMEGT